MKNDIDKKPELLAPAGTLECAITAYEAGADAVYAGLEKFNARAKGKNFSFDDMSKLSAYTKQHGKKFYVTMNTVIKESEILNMAKELTRLSTLEPDAVIVQDIGVARMVRELMPDTPLHASTQMGIHNTAGIEVAKDMGVERVILEREVTMDELKLIMKKSPMEVEVFIHGALCSSLSGNCIWSSWLGGWSGNRGTCKQVCRRRFHTDAKKDEDKKAGFFFSTHDMYALDLIPKLVDLGVSSFKIEGRLKGPDYVKNVVTAYRMMIDAPKKEEKEVLKKAKCVLADSLGRKWSHGFLSEKDMNSLIQYDSMGVSGQLCGNVVQTSDLGFAMEVTRRIHKGDRLRIQPKSGDEGPAVTITKMSVDRKPTNKATKGERAFIHFDRDVPRAGIVYKIGSSVADQSGKINSLPLFTTKTPIDLSVGVYPNGLEVKILSLPDKPVWRSDFAIDNAQSRSVDNDTLAAAFAETRSAKYKLGALESKIKGELFLPAGTLKKQRRAFWEWAEEQLSELKTKSASKERFEKFKESYNQLEPADAGKEREVCLTHSKGDQPKKKHTLVARSVYECNKKTDEAILPHFCTETKLDSLKKRIKEAYDLGIRRFRVTSLYQIELLKKYKDIVKTSSYPFPVLNSSATLLLKDFGFSRVQAWIELEEGQFTDFINHSQLPVELYRYGRPALFATRANVHVEGMISDSRGTSFNVKCDKGTGINYVYPKEVLSIPKMNNTIDCYDMLHAWWGERETTEFNLKFELK